jgi:hypothetical protein
MSEGLFISYRRSDTQSATGRLADHLRQNGFGGEGDMFLDIDHRIPPGVDFRAVINDTLAGCDLVIVVMGRHWLDASDSKGRRLDRTSDTHRLEVAAALKSAARVIPVLVEGTSHPSDEDLPDDLKKLAFLQSWSLGERNYAGDVETLAHEMLDARRQMEAEREQAAAAETERAEEAERDRAAAEAAAAEQERQASERAEAAAKKAEREEAATADQERGQVAAEAAAAEKERQASERAKAAAAENQRARPATEAVSEEKELGTNESGAAKTGPTESPEPLSSAPKPAGAAHGLRWLKTNRIWIGGLAAVAAVALIVGTVLVVAESGGQIELYPHDDSVDSAVFNPDGTRIVTASRDHTAGVWDPDGTPLATLNHDSIVWSAVFSPDGTRIVTASDDGTARVWNPDGALLATLNHDTEVRSAVFSPDGTRILTASNDGTARVWHPDGGLLTTLEGHNDGVRSAVFSPDGTRILTASNDNTARLWSPTPER